jgi:protein-arginine kinase activator protein McsA
MLNEDLPYDIIFLKKRLDYVVEIEEYEKAAIIKRWIDELMVFYNIEKKSNKDYEKSKRDIRRR